MKKTIVRLLPVLAFAIVLQGCVAFPPLIQVQHRDGGNADLIRRLDSIDKRLQALESKAQK
jgi:hypothetical protein